MLIVDVRQVESRRSKDGSKVKCRRTFDFRPSTKL